LGQLNTGRRQDRLERFVADMKRRRDRIRTMLSQPPRNEGEAQRRSRWVANAQKHLAARLAWLDAYADHADLLAEILAAAPQMKASPNGAKQPEEQPRRRRYPVRGS
jgi:hypothetical protein